MRPAVRTVPLAAVLLLAGACSDVDDLPDDGMFTTCLERAGVDVDAVGGVEERREAFSDPAALSCVSELPRGDDREAVLAGAFTDVQLWPVLQDWVGTREGSAEVVAREAGQLVAAAGSDPDEFEQTWQAAQLDENLALVVHEHADGAAPSRQAWLDDADAQQSVSASDPLSAGSQYLNWLEDRVDDDETLVRVRVLREAVREGRDDA